MGTYEDLKAAIQQIIRTNGNNEITGALLQQTLLSIVNSVGANAAFAGIATPNTNPGTADQNVFYLATEAGTYVNFGNIEINEGEAVILSNKTGNWTKTTSGFATQQQLTELGQKVDDNYPYFQPNMLTPTNMADVTLSGIVAARNYDKNSDINTYVNGAYSSTIIAVTAGEVYYISYAVVGGANVAAIIFYDSDGANKGYMYDSVGADYVVIQNKVVWIPKGVTQMRFSFNPQLNHVIKKGDYNFAEKSEIREVQSYVDGLEKEIKGFSDSHTYTGTGYDFNVALAAGDRLNISVSEHTTVVIIYGRNADNSYTLLKNIDATTNAVSIDIATSFVGFRTFFNTSGTYSVNWILLRGISKDINDIENDVNDIENDVNDIENDVSTLQSKIEAMAQKIDTTFIRAAFRKVLCVGDSVTHGLISDYPVVGYNTTLTSYPVYLGKLTGWNVRNAGHSSWNTKEWYNQWFANYNYGDYDLVLIEFGYNRGFTDTLATDAPLATNWVPGTAYSVGAVVTYNRLRYKCVNANNDAVWTPANWAAGYAAYADTDTGNYCRIIEGMLAQNPALCIAIVIPARFFEGWRDRNVIEAIANRYELPIVDLHSDKYFNLNAAEYHGYLNAEQQASGTLDLTHFNALGYLVKAESLFKLFCDAIWSVKTYFNANIEDRLLATRDSAYNYDYEGYINMA